MTKADTTNPSPQDYRKCDFIPYDFVRMCIDNVQNMYATYYVEFQMYKRMSHLAYQLLKGY